MKDQKVKLLEQKTANMRRRAIRLGMKAKGKGAHFGASFSAMEIFSCLYGGIMNYQKGTNWNHSDLLIVGKGHSVLAYYSALVEFNLVSEDELESFDEDGSRFPGHPLVNEELGIYFASGSLGMALSQGAGMALSRKRRGEKSRIYVLLGDGECQEGAIWEAAMSASHFHLDNLTVIVDRNHLQYDGNTEDVMSLGEFAAKWRSFGFDVTEVDGNDLERLYPALCVKGSTGKPVCIIADTIKGKGVSFMEGKKEWHHKVITEEEYAIAMEELDGDK